MHTCITRHCTITRGTCWSPRSASLRSRSPTTSSSALTRTTTTNCQKTSSSQPPSTIRQSASWSSGRLTPPDRRSRTGKTRITIMRRRLINEWRHRFRRAEVGGTPRRGICRRSRIPPVCCRFILTTIQCLHSETVRRTCLLDSPVSGPDPSVCPSMASRAVRPTIRLLVRSCVWLKHEHGFVKSANHPQFCGYRQWRLHFFTNKCNNKWKPNFAN